MLPQSTHDCRRRTGFTLIELLMVLAIIGILIGLLVPVIANAFAKGKQAAESTEITNLAGALQKFKDRYGVYPPSQIILREDGAYNASMNPTVPAAPQDTFVYDEKVSIQYIRRIWPQLVIHTDGTAVTLAEVGDINGDGTVDSKDFYDWNGDYDPSSSATNQPNGPWYLQGDECLAFFLGGLPTGQYLDSSNNPQRPTGNYEPRKYPAGSSGFGKVPQWPTQRVISSAGRDGPFFDLPTDRLVDRDNDSFWELIPYRKPSLEGAYAYFSAYEGVGYRPDDLNLVKEPAPNGSATQTQNFGVLWPIASTYPTPYRQGTSPNFYIRSPGPNPYTIGIPYSTAVGWVARYQKPDGFQIISPGPQVGYGHGGEFPLDEALDNRDDNDNLTNFSGGPLQDGK